VFAGYGLDGRSGEVYGVCNEVYEPREGMTNVVLYLLHQNL